MNPEKIKEDFPMFRNSPELTYLDSASTSQKPDAVIQRIKKFYSEQNANTGRGLYDLATASTEAYESARKTVAEFINASPDEIVFVRNTTEAENLLAYSLEFEGDVVVGKMAHHSEQLPWRRRAEEDGRNIKMIDSVNGKIDLEDARQKIDAETGLVSLTHISNVYGAENPVKEIIKTAHRNDALVVLDAAQSAPHIPLDVRSLGADFVTFSGHKMLGPTGIGVLCGKRDLLDMKPYQLGGGMVNSVTEKEVEYKEPPQRFESGTPNIAGAVGLAAAIEYLEEIGMENIRDHSIEMADLIREKLAEIEGVDIISPEEATLVSFTVDFAHPHDVSEVLNQNNVAVRAGLHCAHPEMKDHGSAGSIRASPYLYTTEEDVEKLVEGIEEVKEVFDVSR